MGAERFDVARDVAYAADSGVTPAIEALQCDETNLVRSSEELERLLDDVADDRLAVCLDLGAAWRAGDSIPGYFKRLVRASSICIFPTSAR